jgi:hypothetical protein
MQKDLNMDTLPPAIGYETKSTLSSDHSRNRSGTVTSNITTDNEAIDFDPEVLGAILDAEPSESPNQTLRKRMA